MAMNINVGKSYSKMYLATTSLHIASLVVLIPAECYALVVLNVFSIILYIGLAILAQRLTNLVPLFYTCAGEIAVFTILSQLLLGEECGYLFLLMATIPIVFYLVYAGKIKNFKKTLKICCGIVILFYFACGLRFAGFYRLYDISKSAQNLLFVFNSVSAFFMLIGFLVLFNVHVKNDQDTLEKENVELENSANYDALTKILNRRSFDNYIVGCFRDIMTQGKDFSILMCDIDDFKKVNDTYGHDCGDVVLVEVAKTIKNVLRSGDVVFRWGGEEILILVRDGKTGAQIVAERCRKSIEEIDVLWKNQHVKVTATIGGCSYYQGATKDTMIESADENLYHGKKNGKNQVVI